MLKKFIGWFFCFGLSFLIQNLGWTEQGKAFLYIHLGIDIIIAIICLLVVIFASCFDMLDSAEASGITLLIVLAMIGVIALILFSTWGATKLFNIDFYVAYQIMTFGQCLCSTSKKNDD